MADVFISYSGTDEPIARAIAARLRDAGVSCWIACENTAFGESYAKTITENMMISKVVLVCMSRAAGASDHVEAELNMAFTEKKTILPILLEDFDLSGTCFKYYAGSTHYMRFEPTEQFRLLLVGRVRQLLGDTSFPPPPPPPPPAPPKKAVGWGWIIAAVAIFVFIVIIALVATEPWAGGGTASRGNVSQTNSTYSFEELRITLPGDFYQDVREGDSAYYYNGSDEVGFYVEKLSFAEYDVADATAKEMLDLYAGEYNNYLFNGQNDPPYCTYRFTNDNNETARFVTFLYRTDDAFWFVEFFTMESVWSAYRSDIFRWSETVTFVN